jgi:predicted metalloendopeptidase
MIKNNFYQYVNGKELKVVKFIKGYSQYSEGIKIQHDIYKKLSSLKDNKDSIFCRHLNIDMDKCYNKNKTIQHIINIILDLKDIKDVPSVLNLLYKNGCSIFFTLHVNPDFNGVNEIVYFEEHSLKCFSSEYVSFLLLFFKIHQTIDIKNVKKFEKYIHRFAYNFIQKKKVKLCYNPQTIKESSWFYHFFKSEYVPEKINLDNPKTYQEIENSFTRENLQIWKDLLLLSWLDHCCSLFTDSFLLYVQEHQDLEIPLLLHKTQILSNVWWQDAGEQYVINFVSEKSFEIAEMLIDIVVQKFKYRIESSNLEDVTKKNALKKLVNMQIYIGRTNHELPYKKHLQQFDELYFDGYHYQYDRLMSRADRLVNKRQWREMGFHIVNAYYITELNTVFLPAAIISNLNKCSTVKMYADHARVIAHEIAHAFDSQARQCDEFGQIKNWWTHSDDNNYKKNCQKLSVLYKKIGINSKLTLAENIADLISLEIAFECWKDLYDDEENSKLFFIEYTRSQICKTSKDHDLDALKTDTHSHAEARSNIPLSCLLEFQSIFHITKNDQMFVARQNIPRFL